MKIFKTVLFVAALATSSNLFGGVVLYTTTLSGANESPANPSTATGTASFLVDNIANTILINISFTGLSTVDTAAHIHCCVAPGGNAGVATAVPSFAGFPLGVTSGSFTNQLFSLVDPSFYNPSFITNNGGTAVSAEAVLLAGMAAGNTYFNIHTSSSTGGEIRGFITATPEPGTFVLAGAALAGVAFLRRRRASR
jgi:CHRD domain/PEP-CTERM motif